MNPRHVEYDSTVLTTKLPRQHNHQLVNSFKRYQRVNFVSGPLSPFYYTNRCRELKFVSIEYINVLIARRQESNLLSSGHEPDETTISLLRFALVLLVIDS